jgi:hypothetical protein
MSSVAPRNHQREANPTYRPSHEPKTHIRRQLQRHVMRTPRWTSRCPLSPGPSPDGGHSPSACLPLPRQRTVDRSAVAPPWPVPIWVPAHCHPLQLSRSAGQHLNPRRAPSDDAPQGRLQSRPQDRTELPRPPSHVPNRCLRGGRTDPEACPERVGARRGGELEPSEAGHNRDKMSEGLKDEHRPKSTEHWPLRRQLQRHVSQPPAPLD